MLPTIDALKPHFQSQNFNVPKLQFFDGERNVNHMLREYTPLWRESMKEVDSTWWGYQDHIFVECYMKWLERVWKHPSQGEKIKLISNRTNLEKNLEDRVLHRSIKYISKKAEFTTTVWVLGSYIVMIFTRAKPHYAFQIHDGLFASNLRTVSKIMWEDIAKA